MSQHSAEDCQNAFIHMLVTEAYEAGVRSAIQILSQPHKKRPPAWQAVGEWYCSLSERDRERASELVRMVADVTTFGCCCVLDNLKLTPLGDRKVIFSLFAENYVPTNDERTKIALPVRINDPQRLELLHDLFRSLVQIWPDKNESNKQ